MPSLFLLLCGVLSLTSFIQAKGTKPPDDFECHLINMPQRIDVVIETGSKTFAGTNDGVGLLLRDSQGGVCIADDLDNSGDDHETNSIDHYALCCPEDFAKAHDSLSMLLLGHRRGQKGSANDWFIERIEVHRKDIVLFTYRFHAWTEPFRVVMFGASKVPSSHSNNGKPSYSLIRL